MTEQSYDIEKVKEYFLYATYPQLAIVEKVATNGNKIIDEMKKDLSKVIEDTIWSCIMFGLLICPFIVLLHIKLPIFVASIISLIIAYYFLRYYIKEIKKAKNLSCLQEYFNLKSTLNPSLIRFWNSTKKDILTDGVDVIEVDEIRGNMEHISSLISLISGPLLQFQKNWIDLPYEAKKTLDEFISMELDWIMETIEKFRESLALWLTIHANELSAYERENLSSKSESIYALASSRLESHIKEVEKVRVRI